MIQHSCNPYNNLSMFVWLVFVKKVNLDLTFTNKDHNICCGYILHIILQPLQLCEGHANWESTYNAI